MSDIEDQGSLRASRSIPSERGADIAAKRQAWDRACRDWSRDNCTDILKTMGLGEAVMFAATDLICALDAADATEPDHKLAGYEAEGRMNQQEQP